MADVTSLLGKMTIGSNITDGAATGNMSPFLSLLPELFQEIVKHASQRDRISLSQTCQLLRYSPEMERALLAEPLSRWDLPMNYEQSSDSNSLLYKEPVWGYTHDLHEYFKQRDNNSDNNDGRRLSVLIDYSEQRDNNIDKAARIKQATRWLTARQYNRYCSMLNEAKGSKIRKLAIPNFFTIEDVQQFEKYCKNIRHLDLASFMPPIDSRVAGAISDSKNVSWEGLMTKCAGIFANVRSIRVGYSASDNTVSDRTLGNQGLGTLAMLLSQAPRLECLELCFTGPLVRDIGHNRFPDLSFIVPQAATALIECLAAHASQRLNELRLDNMLIVVRSLPVFMDKLGEFFPDLTKVSTTIDKDLQLLGCNKVLNQYHLIQNMTFFERALCQKTTKKCGEYLCMLKELAKNPRWKFTSLDSGNIHALPPRAFFVKSNENSDAVESFRFLKERLNWLPTFNWFEQMNYYTNLKPLYKQKNSARDEQIALIRNLFKNIKKAGIPVQLLLSTTCSDPRYIMANHRDVDHGACFTKSSETISDLANTFGGTYYWPNHNYWSTTKNPHLLAKRSRIPWYLEKVEDLVDQFMVFERARVVSDSRSNTILLDHAFVRERIDPNISTFDYDPDLEYEGSGDEGWNSDEE